MSPSNTPLGAHEITADQASDSLHIALNALMCAAQLLDTTAGNVALTRDEAQAVLNELDGIVRTGLILIAHTCGITPDEPKERTIN